VETNREEALNLTLFIKDLSPV